MEKGQILTSVEADADPDLNVRHVPHPEGPYAVKDVQGQVAHLGRVAVTVTVGNSGGNHVGISNGLDFVHVKVLDDVVKYCVEIIEHLEYLSWLAGGGQVSEANNVTRGTLTNNLLLNLKWHKNSLNNILTNVFN